MEKYERETYKGYLISTSQCDCDESPREWGNLGVMICFHRNYELGDKEHGINKEAYYDDDKGEEIDMNSLEDIAEQIRYKAKDRGGVVSMISLTLYDHSGISMSTGTKYESGYCDARWDCSDVGFIVAYRDDVLKEFNVKKITKRIVNKVDEMLKQEVSTYDQYLRGDVYDMWIDDLDEVSGGYYDEESGLEWARETIDCHIEKMQKEKTNKLKALITNKVPLEYRVSALSKFSL